MAIEVEIKKWGNSLGIIIPKEILLKEGLKEKDKILVNIVRKSDIHSYFGSLKRKSSGQEFKDLVKEDKEI